MKVSEVACMIESWAPPEIAWEKDNVGLQIGDPSAPVHGVIVALDVTREVLLEARDKKATLVVSHHPLLFRPLRNLREGDSATECIKLALRHDIAVYSAHTNLDFTLGGTSFALAALLELEDSRFLLKSYKPRKKVITYVPSSHADRLMEAMAMAGAGRIGNYDSCSFRTDGLGTFRGNENSNPTTGKKGEFQRVEEQRLEMIVDSWNVGDVVEALIREHPYEEPAYEVYPTENITNEYGMGTLGVLKRPRSAREFLRFVKSRLGAQHLRFGGNTSRPITRVALCGGSGSDLLDEAIRQGADAFVTADIKYHSFHDAGERILLIDAGHFETEIPVVQVMADRIRKFVRENREAVSVAVARKAVNPIMYA